VGQEGAMRCSGAGGAQNWRRGAVEVPDGDGQRSSGKVVERGKERECGCARGNRRREKFTGRIPNLKRGTRVGSKQLLAVDSARDGSAGGGATRPCEEEPAGLGKRRAGELGPGGTGRAARGQLAAGGNTGDGRRAVLQRNR
jgi:hypothetical protein